MKASITLFMALGALSQPVLAQVVQVPRMTPMVQAGQLQTAQVQTPPQDTQRAPGTGMHPPGSPPMEPSVTDIPPPTPPGSYGTGSGSSDTPAGSGAGTAIDSSPGIAPEEPGGTSDSSGAMQSEAGEELRAAPPPMAGLKPMVQGDVTYLCGGVGADEASYVKQQAKDYDLMLTFAARDGSYLADVDVDIADAKGNSVLQASCDAPIMLVDLPKSGNYRVRADAAGYTLNRTVKVATAKKSRSHVASASLVWPQQVAEGPASAPTATGESGTGESESSSGDNEGEGGTGNDGTENGAR